MRHLFLRLAVVILSVSLLLLAGCSFRRREVTRLYVLTSLPGVGTAAAGTAAEHNVAIGVGPVELPQYLNRPQIVTRESQNELRLAQFDLWAEPLQNNFSRVLVENLSILLAPDRFAVYPWSRSIPVRYRVAVEVTRFYGEAGGDTSLVARWNIIGQDGKDVRVSKNSSFNESAGAQDYEATVSAMSRTLAALSRDIAAAVRALPR
jgi:uncharacterized protein